MTKTSGESMWLTIDRIIRPFCHPCHRGGFHSQFFWEEPVQTSQLNHCDFDGETLLEYDHREPRYPTGEFQPTIYALPLPRDGTHRECHPQIPRMEYLRRRCQKRPRRSQPIHVLIPFRNLWCSEEAVSPREPRGRLTAKTSLSLREKNGSLGVAGSCE